MSVDLSTRYLGLELRNPIVIGPGPVSMDLCRLAQLEAAGAAAVVLPSLFEEEVEGDGAASCSAERDWQPWFAVLRELLEYNGGCDAYLRHVEAAKRALSMPVIATLNGTHVGKWLRFARLIEQAGADALELNIYLFSMQPDVNAAAVEQQYVELVAAVRALVEIPIAVKVGPFFCALPALAKRLVEAGADGLVLFNRLVQSDIDLHSLSLVPHLPCGSREQLRLPIFWIAILRKQLNVSLAAAGGIHFAEDLLKAILAGADVGMLASAVSQHGPDHVRTMLAEVEWWLEERHFRSLEQVKGIVRAEPWTELGAFERADYIRTLVSRSASVTGRQLGF